MFISSLSSALLHTKGFYLEMKSPGFEADHLPPYSTEVEKEWSYASVPTV